MNIFVCVKQVPDTETKIIPNVDGTFIETNSVKWVMNPYDEYAVEQALLVQKDNPESTVTALRVGAIKSTEVLRTAMAMGAEESILIEASDGQDCFSTAKALKAAIEKTNKAPDLIFMGKQAIDDDCFQVPGILSELLDIPVITNVSSFEITGKEITATREIEGGTREVYSLPIPAIISCEKGLNTPRYASLPGIMKAKKKLLTKFSLQEIGVSEGETKLKYFDFELPAEKQQGKIFDATDKNKHQEIVKDIVKLLQTETKLF